MFCQLLQWASSCFKATYRPSSFVLSSSCYLPILLLFTLSSLWHAAMSRQMKFCPTPRGSLISPLCRAPRRVWLTPCRVSGRRPPAAADTHPPTCNDCILLFHYCPLLPGIGLDNSARLSCSSVNILMPFRVIYTSSMNFSRSVSCVIDFASWNPNELR